MQKNIGRYTVYLGIILVAAGLILGFGAMFHNPESVFVNAIGLIPLGFVILLAGTVVSVLHPPRD